MFEFFSLYLWIEKKKFEGKMSFFYFEEISFWCEQEEKRKQRAEKKKNQTKYLCFVAFFLES